MPEAAPGVLTPSQPQGRRRVFWSPAYEPRLMGLEKLHPFDIQKFAKIERHLREHGVPKELFEEPAEVERAALEAVHPADFLDSLSHPKVLSMALEIPLPAFLPPPLLDTHLLTPLRRMVGGTVAAARFAAEGGLAINLGGGFHHARPELAHGFCLYNDVAVAVADLRRGGFTANILLVDTDAHQGDGNHAFFVQDPSVFCLSIHQGDLFPHPKVPGDLDLELPAGAGDAEMLELLEQTLPEVLSRVAPGLTFHVAGVDVLHTDPLSRLEMSVQGVVDRDRLVADRVLAHSGLVHLLAGGYGPEAWKAQAASVLALLG